jgi:hypothetical protein
MRWKATVTYTSVFCTCRCVTYTLYPGLLQLQKSFLHPVGSVTAVAEKPPAPVDSPYAVAVAAPAACTLLKALILRPGREPGIFVDSGFCKNRPGFVSFCFI